MRAPDYIPSVDPLTDFIFTNSTTASGPKSSIVTRCPFGSIVSLGRRPQEQGLSSGYWIEDDEYRVCNQVGFKQPPVGADGCFTALVIRRSGVEIHSDSFGLYPIYYYDNGETFAAGNRLHLLLLTLIRSSIRLDWDWDYAAPLFVPRLLSGQFCTMRLPVRGLRLLEPHQALRYGPDGISLRDTIARDKTRNYQRLIRDGFEGVRNRVRLAVNTGKTYLHLSGGYDSRITFGAALPYMDKIRCLAHGTQNADFRISGALANRFGGSFISGMRPGLLPIPVTSLMNEVRSFSLGSYNFPIDLYPHRADRPFTEVLSINGYGGEMFRPFLLKYLKLAAGFTESDLARALSASFMNTGFTKEHTEHCVELIKSEMLDNSDLPLYLRVESHYRRFRNRLHFGCNLRLMSYGSWTLHPLMQREFIYALDTIDETSFRENQIPFDLMSLGHPDLPRLPFDTSDKAFPSSTAERGIVRTSETSFTDRELEAPPLMEERSPVGAAAQFSNGDLDDEIELLFRSATYALYSDTTFASWQRSSPERIIERVKELRHTQRLGFRTICLAYIGMHDLKALVDETHMLQSMECVHIEDRQALLRS